MTSLRMPTEYLYSTAPQAVKPSKKSKADVDSVPLQMLADPRVVKGNTHSLARQVALANKSLSEGRKPVELGKTVDPKVESCLPSYSFFSTPFVQDDIDISVYLTEVPRESKKCDGTSTQTDFFQERPETPPYVARKTGIDNSTQVDDVTELFDFNREVAPLVEVIVQKTLEQALFEVKAEMELLKLQNDVQIYVDHVAKENEWSQLKLQETKVEFSNKQNELKKKQAEAKEQTKIRTIVAGLQLVRQIVPDILDGISSDFFSTGAWKRADEEVIASQIIFPIVADVRDRYEVHGVSYALADELLNAAQERYLEFKQTIGKRQQDVQLRVRVRAANVVVLGETETSAGEDREPSDVDLPVFMIEGHHTIDLIEREINGALKKLSMRTVEPPHVHKHFRALLNGRDIAVDAPVLNFPLPSKLNFLI